MQNKGHSSKNHPSMPVHVLPDYNRQFNKWESSQSTLFVKYLLFTCFRLQPLLLLQDFFIDCVRIMSLFFWQSVLYALLSWTYIAFQAKNHWSRERIQAKEAQECHWLDFSQLLQRNPVLPSSTPPLVTRFSHWLCSDYVPFLLTKCLVCFAELNLHCFSSKKSLKQRKDSSKRSSGMSLAWL